MGLGYNREYPYHNLSFPLFSVNMLSLSTKSFFASIWFLIQGLGGLIWWLVLFFVPTQRHWFIAPDLSEAFLLFLAIPDIPIFVGLSLGSAFLLWKKANWVWTERVVWFSCGGVLYPTLHVIAETIRSDGHTWVASVLMTPSLLGSLFMACWCYGFRHIEKQQ